MSKKSQLIDKNHLIGLSYFLVKEKLSRQGLTIGEIYFRESRIKRLTVLDVLKHDETNVVDVVLAGANPIRYLPSIYQKSEFLRHFLWLFQHISYDITGLLDNIHRYFTPVEAPIDFVKWISTWFSMRLDFSDDEDRMRSLLQFAVPLYRWRGTVIGLKKLLLLFTGIEPIVLENEMPYEAFTILGETQVSAPIIDTSSAKVFFTVHFPVPISDFKPGLIQKVSRIVTLEKPAHTSFFLTFLKQKKNERNIMTVSEELTIGKIDETTV